MKELMDFIANLQLPEAGRPWLQTPPESSAEIVGDSAAVAGESLVSFVSGLSQQAREDVLNSTLLMQLAASKMYDKATQREEWFKFYTEGLARLGWTLSHQEMHLYHPSQQSFTVDGVALEMIGGATGGSAFSSVAQRTFEALRKEPHALRLFLDNSNSGNVGTFQIMPCAQSVTGEVTMLLNCMQVVRNVTAREFLFMTFGKNDLRIYRSTQTSVLNVQTYAQVRQAVIAKLGQHAQRFVAHLKI
ncbi:MAG: hypothetical protein LBJ37_08645 [Paucimonas sp.]|jgi:hypothetical protein|nr:hypothetical protein [Paucimonas sp.]